MNKNYVKGRAFEYEIMKKLREDDYTCVRSAGSKGPFDILAMNERHFLLIQAKKDTKCTLDEKKRLKNFENHPYNAIKMIWRKEKGKIIKEIV